MKYYLAIDIGAASGRHIVAHKENDEIISEEIYRFSNGVKEEDGHLVWDVDYLFAEVKKGIKEALKRYEIESLSIDTWGVDYVLLDGDKEIYPVYAYRDARTKEYIDEVHSLIPFKKLYECTGSQFQPFNSIYQFYTDKMWGRLEKATDYLMIPEYLLYKLTGIKIHEFTNATTTGMINHETLEFDKEIIEKLELPERLFTRLTKSGYIYGCLKEEIQQEVNGNCRVMLCTTHDTASAVEGIPMVGNELYISSGTWSLLGVKTEKPLTDEGSMKANYSNEGGVGYNRYQKNIMGLWLVQELKKELCPLKDWVEITEDAEKSACRITVDVEDEIFLAPSSMKDAFIRRTGIQDMKDADLFRCAYESLAKGYKRAIEELECNTGKVYEKLYIVGGGAKNRLLNRLTEEYTGKRVIALPIEATALGNFKAQMEKN